MYQRALRPDELMHHGILGQKWGVRRFQNPDGTLTAAGRRKIAKKYDYTQSDKYKNGSEKTRAEMTNQHNQTKRVAGLSKGQRNRIDYEVFEEGKDRKNVTDREIAKVQATSVALYVGYKVGKTAVQHMIKNGELGVSLNNAAVTQYAEKNGLNTVKGGPSTGVSAVIRGRKIMKDMFGI